MTAPIAQVEDDWTNFTETSSSIKSKDAFSDAVYSNLKSSGNFEESSNSEESNYGSMEDLVNKFEEKIANCFKTELPLSRIIANNRKLSDVSLSNLEDFYDCDKIWKRLTDNYGLVQPLDWKNSTIKKCFMPALNFLSNKSCSVDVSSVTVDEIDDRILQEEMNLHNVIEYNIYTEKNTATPDLFQPTFTRDLSQSSGFQTADEVIQELEEIMLDADQQDAAFDTELQDHTGIIISDHMKEKQDWENVDYTETELKRLSVSSEDGNARVKHLKKMSCVELNEELSQLENTVKKLSQELLNELDLRDELKYINETRNTLISKIMEVQYKQEQFYKNSENHNTRKRFGKLSKSFSTASNVNPGRFLTTIIPVEQTMVPNVEIMQVLIKILDAIKADSDEVPSLLTTYILKVLVPAPINSNALNL